MASQGPAANTRAPDANALLPGADEAAEELDTFDDAEQSGPCAGIIESLSLVFVVPGFARFALFLVLMAGGVTVPWVYVLPPLQQRVWGEKAASYTSFMQAGRSLLSMLLAAHFGKWSDKKGRRLMSLVVMTIAGFCIGLPVLLLGSTEQALWVCVALIVLTGPMAVHLTGSPVIWAFAADILPAQHRETGFGIIMACTSFGNFSIQLIAKLLADALPDCSQIYYWVTLACLGISLLLLFSLRNVTALNFEPDEDEAHQGHEQRGCLAGLLSPARLIYRKATLRAVCMVAAVLTFAELAASDMSAQVLYEMLGITHAGAAKQQEASFYYVCLPNPLIVLVTILVGLAARRFSPHRFVRVWIPITAVIFACPALLTIYHENWAIIIGGFCAILPLTNYAPLQALVVHVVPSSRVGEAMGSMAACKNLVSFVAPFIMGAMAETLARTDNSDKLWVIYPGCAVIMFCAWPLTWLLQSRVPRDSRATWSSWASTARPSLFMARPSTMRLSTGARPSTARLSTGTRPSTGTAPTAPPGT